MADRIAVMNHGKLQQYGTREEIYNHPANMFVAGFIGSPSMNFIEGSLQHDGERLSFISPHVRHSFDAIQAAGIHSDAREVVLGVRPEAIIVNHTRQGEDDIEATVDLEEPLGADLLLVLRLGERQLIARTDPDFGVGQGDRVWIHPRPDKVHLFDARTERRIMQ